jgi:hypothetical protein
LTLDEKAQRLQAAADEFRDQVEAAGDTGNLAAKFRAILAAATVAEEARGLLADPEVKRRFHDLRADSLGGYAVQHVLSAAALVDALVEVANGVRDSTHTTTRRRSRTPVGRWPAPRGGGGPR